MTKKAKTSNNAETPSLNIADVSGNFFDKEGWDALGEEEGEGDYCCGKRRVEMGNTFTCLKCGSWSYSSS